MSIKKKSSFHYDAGCVVYSIIVKTASAKLQSSNDQLYCCCNKAGINYTHIVKMRQRYAGVLQECISTTHGIKRMYRGWVFQ